MSPVASQQSGAGLGSWPPAAETDAIYSTQGIPGVTPNPSGRQSGLTWNDPRITEAYYGDRTPPGFGEYGGLSGGGAGPLSPSTGYGTDAIYSTQGIPGAPQTDAFYSTQGIPRRQEPLINFQFGNRDVGFTPPGANWGRGMLDRWRSWADAGRRLVA